MKGRGRRGPEESEDGLFFLLAIGDEAFCLPEPASVHNAYLLMTILFLQSLIGVGLSAAFQIRSEAGVPGRIDPSRGGHTLRGS